MKEVEEKMIIFLLLPPDIPLSTTIWVQLLQTRKDGYDIKNSTTF
jgi:hypothetical protein